MCEIWRVGIILLGETNDLSHRLGTPLSEITANLGSVRELGQEISWSFQMIKLILKMLYSFFVL